MIKIVFFSPILNNHQNNISNELWNITSHSFIFVELQNLTAEHRKGDMTNYSSCPYLLQAWKSRLNYAKAMNLAKTAECCIFSSIHSLPFQKERMKLGLLSFDMSERWLKRGILNIFSPSILKMYSIYLLGRWNKKPLYKLCCSAYAAKDQYILGTFKDKCYKWGYFTKAIDKITDQSYSYNSKVLLMWCARYLKLKHPEIPIIVASKLKEKGYDFVLDMFGSGKYENKAKKLADRLDLHGTVNFHGSKENNIILQEMAAHDIFLFTSDKNEGWGAVANESMSNGCAIIAGDTIGCTKYLINDKINGLISCSPKCSSGFNNPDNAAINSIVQNVEWLINNPSKMKTIQHNAREQIITTWSPHTAAERLIKLIECLNNGKETIFKDGPCSKA